MSISNSTLTVERVREALEYDSKAGTLTWKIYGSSTAPVGRVAGNQNPVNKYIYVKLDKQIYLAHRLIWFHVHGVWPKSKIDHKNGIRTDNSLPNLREVTDSENCENKRPSSYGVSGLLGVSRHGSRWRANIRYDGRQHYIGTFATPEDAHQAYLERKRIVHAGCTI